MPRFVLSSHTACSECTALTIYVTMSRYLDDLHLSLISLQALRPRVRVSPQHCVKHSMHNYSKIAFLLGSGLNAVDSLALGMDGR